MTREDKEFIEAIKAVTGKNVTSLRFIVIEFGQCGGPGSNEAIDLSAEKREDCIAAIDREIEDDPHARWGVILDRAAEKLDVSTRTLQRHGYGKDPRTKDK